PAELLELPRYGEALHPLLDHEERDAVVAALLGGLHGGDDEVGAHAVRDEGLRPVHDIAAVHLLRARAEAGDVGARIGLGDAERADLLSGDRGSQPASLLVLGAELPDRRRGDRDVRADPGPQPAAAAP